MTEADEQLKFGEERSNNANAVPMISATGRGMSLLRRQKSFNAEKKLLRPQIEIVDGDTYLKIIFGQERGQKIDNFMYSRPVTLSAALLMVFLTLLGGFDDSNPIILYSKCIGMSIGIFVFIGYILTMNNRVLPFVIYSFEFYIKAGYGIAYAISVLVWQENCDICNENLIKNIIWCIELEFIIVWLCMIDGFPVRRKIKVACLIIGALYFTYEAILSSFFRNDAEYDYITPVFGTFSINWKEMYGNSLQVLALFWWKAVATTMVNRNSAMMIHVEPSLQWVRLTADDNEIIDNINENETNNNNNDKPKSRNSIKHENMIAQKSLESTKSNQTQNDNDDNDENDENQTHIIEIDNQN